MAGTSLYSVHRRTARAAAKQQVVKKTSDIDIERARTDFAYFCDVVGDKPPAAHHKEWHKYLCTGQDTECLIGIGGPNVDILSPRGPLAISMPVATPHGWRPIGDITLGDLVFAEDGSLTEVIDIHDYEKSQTWNVIFSDGSSVVCDEQHLWKVRRIGTDAKNTWRLMTLNEIRTQKIVGVKGNWRTGIKGITETCKEGETPWLDSRGYARYQIPITDPVQYPESDLPIDPYLLGALIGDGGLTESAGIRFTSMDEDIIERCKRSLPTEHEMIPVFGSKYGYRIVKKTRRFGGQNQVLNFLRALGLQGKGSKDKFIPLEYKIACIEDRVALLQGLLDTDGTVGNNRSGGGKVSFCSISYQLVLDVVELVQSLGGVATIHSPQYNQYRTLNGEKLRSENPSWKVGIKLPTSIEPFYVQRKAQSYKPCTKYLPCRSIVRIEPATPEKVRCITVSHEKHTFLTKDYIVSKNSAKSTVTGLFCAWTIGVHALNKKPLKILYISYTVDVARPKSAAIKRIIEESKIYREIFPMVKIAKGINSNEYWSIDCKFAGVKSTGEEEFTLCCAGLKGAVTSKRSHLCLPGATLVRTQQGLVPIHDIYQKPGDHQVSTYNPRNGALEWSGVRAVSRRLTSRLIHVETSTGDLIRATPEHPFYIPGRGILPAQNLQAGDRILSLADCTSPKTSNKMSKLPKNISTKYKLATSFADQQNSGIPLFKKMRRKIQAHTRATNLPGMQPSIPSSEFKQCVLLENMLLAGAFKTDGREMEFQLAPRDEQASTTCTSGIGFKPRQYDLHTMRYQETTVTCKTSIRSQQLDCSPYRCESEEQRIREFNYLVQALPHQLSSNGTKSQDTGVTVTAISEVSDGEEYVYDLETESTNHNFFTGKSGCCVSNCVIDDICKSADEIKNRDIRLAMEDNWNSVITPTMFEGGRAICLGTRFRHDDMHGTTFIPEKDWIQLVQSAIVVDEAGEESSYWPEMWSLEYLQDRRRQAPISFSFQYQNQIVQTSELSLSPDLIIKGQIPTEFDRLGIGVDLSAGVKERNDYSVFVLGGRVGDKVYVIDCKRIRLMGNLEKLEAMMEMMFEWGIVYKEGTRYIPTGSSIDVWSEAVAYQASLEADFKRICLVEHGLYNVLWHPVKGFRGDKVARFRGIMGLFEQHKIRFNKYRKFQALTDEIVNFGVSSHDDCVDALIWLCNGLMARGKLELEY